MIEDKFIRVGQRFRGQVIDVEFEIVEIKKGLFNNNLYVTVKETKTGRIKDKSGRPFETTVKHFKHLLLKAI